MPGRTVRKVWLSDDLLTCRLVVEADGSANCEYWDDDAGLWREGGSIAESASAAPLPPDDPVARDLAAWEA